jgi:hypothetical protein
VDVRDRKKEAIDAILELLTGDPAYTGGHSAIALLGDDTTGIWLRDYGAAKPERYVELLGYLGRERAGRPARAEVATSP